MNRMFFYFVALIACLFAVCDLQAQPAHWTPRGIGGGGALFNPTFNPNSAGEIFMGSDMSEFFRSTDWGESWDVPSYHQLIAGSSGKVSFTNNPSLLYALDGRGDLRTPSKSTDGGLSWNLLASDPTDGDAYSLYTDIHHADRLLVSDYSHVFYSANGGGSFSTAFTHSDCYVAGVFFDADTIYVGTSAGLLVSTNGGSSFSLSAISGIPATESMISLAGARQGTIARLVCLTANGADVYPGIGGGDYQIYTAAYSLDIGQNAWTTRTNGITSTQKPFFVAMATSNIDTIYAAGGDETWGWPIVLRSTNGGVSWTNTFLTTNNQNIATGWCGDHGDLNWGWSGNAMGFAVSPIDPSKLLFTDWGFAHISTNGGTSWKQVYTSTADQNPAGAQTPKGRAYHGIGLEQTSCWQVMWVDSSHVIGSYTDMQGIRSTDGGSSWAHQRIDTTGASSVNTIYYTLKHPVTGTLYAATSSVHDLYQSTYLTDSRIDAGHGQVWYSTDSSRTWRILHDFQHPVVWLAMDPSNSNRMLASVVHSTSGGIFMTTNLQNGTAATWTRLATPPRTEGHPYTIVVLQNGSLLCSYSGRRGGSPQAFTQSSGVFLSTDNGTTWQDVSSPQMVYWTKDLIVDPYDASQNSWYVAVHRGWGGAPNGLGGLFKTTNHGQSWTQISNHLYAESCTISPTDSNVVYLTTETEGLWYCQNLRSASPTFSEVTGYPFVHPIRTFFNPYKSDEVWVASFGNGMRVGSAGADSLSRVNDLTIHRVGDSVSLHWTLVAQAHSYLIYGSETGDFSDPQLLGTTAANSFDYVPTSVHYFFLVIASTN